MVYPASANLLTALAGSHAMSTEVWLLRSPPVQLPIIGGTVQATYRAQVARTATLQVDEQTHDTLGLTTLSDQVLIRTGVPNIEMVPIFVGRVDTVDTDETGTVSVQCVDRGADVVRDRFETPWGSAANISVLDEMERILVDTNPDFAVIRDPDIQDTILPVQMWEEDRAGALDDLAKAVNAIWSANRYGSFTIIRNPYDFLTTPTSVATIRDGVNGTITRIRRTVTRQQVHNSVTVVVERTDGLTPLRATVRDIDANSPTYWGGPFGKQNLIVKNSSVRDAAEATRLAARLLNQSLAAVKAWSISTPHFPILDPGDVITGVHQGDIVQQVVETVTYPLLAVDETIITTRQLLYLSAELLEVL